MNCIQNSNVIIVFRKEGGRLFRAAVFIRFQLLSHQEFLHPKFSKGPPRARAPTFHSYRVSRMTLILLKKANKTNTKKTKKTNIIFAARMGMRKELPELIAEITDNMLLC